MDDPERKVEDCALPVVNAFWKGDRLGSIASACLTSWLAVGHRVVLHVYEQPSDVPKGVELFDARQILAESRVIRHKRTGSWALASDIYRYEVLAAGMGVYVDADMFCLKPLAEREYMFGWESTNEINGAVLKLPASSGILRDLRLAASDPKFIPPWRTQYTRSALRLARFAGLGVSVANARWGTLGPAAITWYARQHHVEGMALPSDYFYPVSHSQIHRLLDPDLTLSDLTTHRTAAIHLYSEALTPLLRNGIPPTSPLGALLGATSLPSDDWEGAGHKDE